MNINLHTFIRKFVPLLIAALGCALQFAHADEQTKAKVLIVTNDAEDETHAFIQKALVPNRRDARFEVTVAQADYLAKKPLDGFATIFLNDVARLNEAQQKALQTAVKQGAGLCFFLGPNADVEYYSRVLHAEGKGLFPLPLGKPTQLPEGESGIVAAKHPLLNVFEGDGKAMLDIVLVSRCQSPADSWNAEKAKSLSVIARSKSGNPIAVSKPHGDGNVVAFMFVPNRRWANWHFYPAWVVMMHELQTFLTEY